MQPSATTQSDISKLAKKMAAKQQAAQNHRGLSSLPEDDPRVAYDEGSACLCSREPDLIREVGIIKKVHEVIDEDGKGAVRYSIKFKDGFLLTNVKPEDLGEVHGVRAAPSASACPLRRRQGPTPGTLPLRSPSGQGLAYPVPCIPRTAVHLF